MAFLFLFRTLALCDTWERLRFLRDALGFEAASVLDIGANVGNWAREAKDIFPEARFLLLEANPQHRLALEASGMAFEIALLTAVANETRVFYTTKCPWPDTAPNTGASLFRERTPCYSDAHARPLHIQTHALDDVVTRHLGRECCDLIKADVQGAEIEVLRGGLQTLRNARVVLLEVSVLRYNEGAPLFSELVAFMAGLGFELLEVADHLRTADGPGAPGGGRLLQLDLLFAPRASTFLEYPR